MKRYIIGALLVVGLLSGVRAADPNAGPDAVILPNLTTDAGGTVTITVPQTGMRPFYFTSVMYTFTGDYFSPLNILSGRLTRASVTSPLIVSTNTVINALVWNVERTHGQFFFRGGDLIELDLSDVSPALFTFSARAK